MTLYNQNRILGHRNLGEELVDIFESDISLTCEMIEGRGLIFFVALFCVLCISILKVFHCLWTYFFDSYTTLGEYTLSRIQNEESRYQMTEKDMTSHLITIEQENKFKPNQKSKQEVKKLEALSFLRSYLFNRNFILHAQIVKSIEHNVSEEILKEYLHTGKIIKPYQTEYVNFGEKVNNSLKDALGKEISLRKIKDCPYPCVAIFNGEIERITKKLEDLFFGNTVKVVFDTIPNE